MQVSYKEFLDGLSIKTIKYDSGCVTKVSFINSVPSNVMTIDEFGIVLFVEPYSEEYHKHLLL